MILPNLTFITNKQKTINDLKYFLFNKDHSSWFYKTLLRDHKHLIDELKQIKGKVKQNELIENYVNKYLSEKNSEINSCKKNIEKNWNLIGKDIFMGLAKILNTNWCGIDKITCNVGIIQAYPRDIDEHYYQIYYKSPIYYSLAVSIHEIIHFLYFKKWKELFPTDKRIFYESPHQYWHLSEIIDSIIAGDDIIRSVFADSAVDVYPEYLIPYNKSENKTIFGFFLFNYLDFKRKNKSIDDFLIFARDKVNKINF